MVCGNARRESSFRQRFMIMEGNERELFRIIKFFPGWAGIRRKSVFVCFFSLSHYGCSLLFLFFLGRELPDGGVSSFSFCIELG